MASVVMSCTAIHDSLCMLSAVNTLEVAASMMQMNTTV